MIHDYNEEGVNDKMTSASNDAASMQINSDEEHVETSPLAFTVQFDPQPEARKLKIHDKLSSFALKHRRNPSLPDFQVVKTAKSQETTETKPSVLNRPHFFGPKTGYHSEGYFSSDQDEESVKLRNRTRNMPRTKISPVTEDRGFVPQLNGHKNLTTTKGKI